MVAQYKEFKIGDLFTYERGKVKAPKQVKEGKTPLISETYLNNGVDRYVKVPEDTIIRGGCITVSVNYARTVFYQDNDFSASVNIIVIRNPKLNKYTGKYIATVLSKNNEQYDYTNKIGKAKLKETILKLPVTATGEPDWEYMETYMKTIEEESEHIIEMLNSVTLDVEGGGV